MQYFSNADTPEIEENEFNLNVPRYVDTFEPEPDIPLDSALRELADAKAASTKLIDALMAELGNHVQAS